MLHLSLLANAVLVVALVSLYRTYRDNRLAMHIYRDAYEYSNQSVTRLHAENAELRWKVAKLELTDDKKQVDKLSTRTHYGPRSNIYV